MSASEFFATIDNVKKKLRIPESDKSIDRELELYAQEVNAWIVTEVRRIVGLVNDNGDPIDVNFTITSNPEIDVDIRARADDLLEGKFRQKTTNDDMLWKDSSSQLRDYLRDIFGWAAGESVQTNPQITLSPETGPVSTVVTVSGIDWAQFEEVTLSIGDITAVTTPSNPIADNLGDLTFTFPVPTLDLGTATVKVIGKNIPRGRTSKIRNVVYTKFVVTT